MGKTTATKRPAKPHTNTFTFTDAEALYLFYEHWRNRYLEERERQHEAEKEKIIEQSGAMMAAAMRAAQAAQPPAAPDGDDKAGAGDGTAHICSLANLVRVVRDTVPEKLSAVTGDDLKMTIDNQHNTKKYKALVSQDAKGKGAERLFYARPLLDYACQLWERKRGQKSWSICIDENEKSMILKKLTGEK